MDLELVLLLLLQVGPSLYVLGVTVGSAAAAAVVLRPKPFLPRSTPMFGLMPHSRGVRGTVRGVLIEVIVEKVGNGARTVIAGQPLDRRGAPAGARTKLLVQPGIATEEQVGRAIATVLATLRR